MVNIAKSEVFAVRDVIEFVPVVAVLSVSEKNAAVV
jgi:hypothetical protein